MNHKSWDRRVRNSLQITALLLVLVMLSVSACNFPTIVSGDSEEQSETSELPVAEEQDSFDDPNAQYYRMFYDGSADPDENELNIRRFFGQLRLANFEPIFGDLSDLPVDDYGNRVADPVLIDGRFWGLIINPSSTGINLLTYSIDGSFNSSLDVDADGIADIVDIQLVDGRRFAFVAEHLGLDIFLEWLKGNKPLCDEEFANLAGYAPFVCPPEGGDSGNGEGQPNGNNYVSPLDRMCAGYDTGYRGPVTMGAGSYSTGTTSVRIAEGYFYDGNNFKGSRVVISFVSRDANNEYSSTSQIITDYDAAGNVIQITEEEVSRDATGAAVGTRVVTTFNNDGTKTKSEPEIIRPELNNNGDYESDAPLPSSHEEASRDDAPRAEEHRPPPPPRSDSDTGDPGPFGGDDIAGFCNQILAGSDFKSSVELAAETDPAAFELTCDDLAKDSSNNADCILIDSALPPDFRDIVLSPGDGCGQFELIGASGDCEPTTASVRLEGLAALIASADLVDVEWCNPLVCGGGEIAYSLDGLDGLDGETQQLSGAVPEASLCFIGPGEKYGVVSALPEGVEVEIVGLGEAPGWLVVKNPIYEEFACWVSDENVQLPEGSDLGDLRILSIPELLPQEESSNEDEDPQDNDPDAAQGEPAQDPGNNQDPGGQQSCGPDEYWSIATQSCEPFG